MTNLFEALFKFFTEFTWRKMSAILIAGVVLLIGLSIHERYTSSLRLNRLQRATVLLASLRELQAQAVNDTPEFQRARESLMNQATKAIEEQPLTLDFIPSKFAFSMEGFWKFLAGGALWWVVALYGITKTKTKKDKRDLVGLVAVAGVGGIVAMYVQPIWWPWFHILVYPWLFMSAVLTVVIPFLLPRTLHRARSKAREVTCNLNLKQIGLASRLWANDNKNGLPRDFATMREQLGTDKVTFCPSEPTSQYQILSPGAADSDPSIVFAHCPVHKHIVLSDGTVQKLGKRRLVDLDGTCKVSD